MDFIEYKFWKLVILAAVVFLVVFFYGLFTGRSLLEDWSERKAARRPGDSEG